MKDIAMIIAGVGGQGVITATTIIGYAALKSGINAISSEVHGMAQRGGIVTVDMRIGSRKSPLIGKGEADIILGFEPVEAYRAMHKLKKDGIIISSTNPIIPFTVGIGAEKYPDLKEIFSDMKKKVERVVEIDALSLAKKAGNPSGLNMVMIGAASKYLGIPAENFEEVIRDYFPEKFVEANLKAFRMGREAVEND